VTGVRQVDLQQRYRVKERSSRSQSKISIPQVAPHVMFSSWPYILYQTRITKTYLQNTSRFTGMVMLRWGGGVGALNGSLYEYSLDSLRKSS